MSEAVPALPRSALTLRVGRASLAELEAVFREHYRSIVRFVEALGVSRPDVDDVAQDVFVIAHRRLHTFDDGGSMRAWLLGIARRTAKDYRRSRARRPPPAEDSTQLGAAPGQDDELQRKEAARIVRNALESMTEGQREVFALFELEGLTAPEIGTLLQLELPAVYSRLKRARSRFESYVAAVEGGHRHG